MKKLFRFLVLFGLVSACFSCFSCTTPNMVWCTSSGIITYDRHTGRFEVLWENTRTQVDTVHDTVYVSP